MTELMQVREWIEESGGLKYTRDLNRRYLARAHKMLESLPNIPARDSLNELIEILDERQY